MSFSVFAEFNIGFCGKPQLLMLAKLKIIHEDPISRMSNTTRNWFLRGQLWPTRFEIPPIVQWARYTGTLYDQLFQDSAYILTKNELRDLQSIKDAFNLIR